ncbi:MAG: amino acid adenylation domain-containing protein [Planctomycetes bacterium]|nr:amino acid adenylation domain-containing protein [Planctomycetota bacterium]
MSMMSVVERFLWARAKYAGRLALEGESRQWTFRDLDADSSRVCGFLRNRGIGKGDIIPVLMDRSPEFVVAALGIVRCGAAFAPIDLASPGARRDQILAGLGARVVLHDDSGAAATLAGSGLVHIGEALAGEPRDCDPEAIGADDPLYVMFTSGSTGTPKGVLVPHRGVVRLVVDADWSDFESSQRWLLNSSIAFDASTLEIWAPLLNGGTCVVQEQPLISFDELARCFVERRISDSWLTASLFNAMVDTHVEAFRGVRQLCTGGERESSRHMREFVAALPGVRLVHGYGPTENTVFSHTHRVTLADTAPGQRVPIGRPIRGTIDRIEREDGSEAGIGEPGELILGGLGVALGYREDAELTRKKFIERNGAAWYRTGDLVIRRSDGAVEFVGRLDRQVKVQGNRIELDEVEAVLRTCPGVGDVFVFVDGESAESKRLVACYIGHGGKDDGVDRVRQYLQERLPRIMVPRVIRRLGRFPLKISGKVDEATLSRLVGLDAVGTERGVVSDDVMAPTEAALAQLWSKRLPGVPIGRGDSLLRLGGHSLLAMRLAADIGREFRCEVSPARLLDAGSLADVARHIDETRDSESSAVGMPLGVARAGGAVPHASTRLVGIQQRLLAASNLSASGDAYIVPVAFTLPSGRSSEELRVAFGTLIMRHEMLRLASGGGEGADVTVFPEPPQGWWTVYDDVIETPVDSWPESMLQRVYRRLDPTACGPTRIDVWPTVGGGWLVIWAMHHAVIDEWSIRLLLDQFVGLLGGAAICEGGDARAFYRQEIALADVERATAQASRVADALDGLSVSFTRWSGPAVEIEIEIGREFEEAIASIARRAGTTTVAPGLAAYGIALQTVLGDAWRFATTPIAKRMSPELIDAVNCCLEMRIIECGARPLETMDELVRRVHRELVSCQDRSFVPFDVITSELRHRRVELASAPVQFGFTWRRDPYPVIQMESKAGAGALRVLRVPQRTTVFGCTLHFEEVRGRLHARLEACEECVTRGIAERLSGALREAVFRLAANAAPAGCVQDRGVQTSNAATDVGAPSQRTGDEGAAGTVLAGVIAGCWKDVLGTAPEHVHTDFFDAGGTSFSLLRLVAIIRQRTGATIDGGRALARPTFGDICENVVESKSRDSRPWIQIGDPAAKHTLVMLPGNTGYSLGMCRLIGKICGMSPVPLRCVVIDLVDVWRMVGKPHPVERVVDRIIAALAEAGVAHPWGIIGYSLGGPLAIAVEQRLAALGKATSRLWIIDGYEPLLMRQDLHVRVVRKAVTVARRAWERLRSGSGVPAQAPAGAPSDWLVCGALQQVTEEIDRVAFQQQLGKTRLNFCDADVVLLRSSIMGRKVNIIRRGATNGFNPAMFRSLRVESAECHHLELVREHSDWTAGIIVSTLGVGPPGNEEIGRGGES